MMKIILVLIAITLVFCQTYTNEQHMALARYHLNLAKYHQSLSKTSSNNVVQDSTSATCPHGESDVGSNTAILKP